MSRFVTILKHWAKKLPYLRPLVEEKNRLRLDVDRLVASLTELQSHAEQLRIERDLSRTEAAQYKTWALPAISILRLFQSTKSG